MALRDGPFRILLAEGIGKEVVDEALFALSLPVEHDLLRVVSNLALALLLAIFFVPFTRRGPCISFDLFAPLRGFCHRRNRGMQDSSLRREESFVDLLALLDHDVNRGACVLELDRGLILEFLGLRLVHLRAIAHVSIDRHRIVVFTDR